MAKIAAERHMSEKAKTMNDAAIERLEERRLKRQHRRECAVRRQLGQKQFQQRIVESVKRYRRAQAKREFIKGVEI